MIADKQMIAHAIIGAGTRKLSMALVSLFHQCLLIEYTYDRDGRAPKWSYDELMKLDQEVIAALYAAARGKK